MRVLASLLLGAALVSGGAAIAKPEQPDPAGEAKLAKLLDGRVAGKPVNCITLHNVDDSQVIDHTAIVYRDGGTLYVNRPTAGRESLDDNDILVTRLWTPQLCSVDVVNLVDRNSRFPRGFVGLGQFVPYTKPKS